MRCEIPWLAVRPTGRRWYYWFVHNCHERGRSCVLLPLLCSKSGTHRQCELEMVQLRA
jgi:hypothetical protein